MSEDSGRVWVYGVVPADAELEQLEGRDDLPEVWLVESGDVAAIVGDAPEDDPKETRNQALGHARVLEAAVRDAPVVPMRFGVMCQNDEEVTSGILEDRHDQLAELLDQLEGHVELVLKVTYHENELLQEILESEPEAAQLRDAVKQGSEQETYDQRVRLGELISNAIEQRRERDSGELLDELEEVVLAAQSEPPEKEMMVLNAPLLVERGRIEELESAVEDMADERADRMHFKLLGPMPAYHFIDSEEPATT
jgi:hypothetical protein